MTTGVSQKNISTPQQDPDALRLENEVLRTFVDTSRDALFCIEFLESVDLTAPEPEIIRQVFENECVWRMCNIAMARLYKLPEGIIIVDAAHRLRAINSAALNMNDTTAADEEALPEHLPPYVLLGDGAQETIPRPPVVQQAEQAVETPSAAQSSQSLKEQVKEFERALIDNAIERLGSKRKAAPALGVDIGTIVRKTQGGQAPPRRH
ncbi:MAG: hypothetical protein GY875_07885 [Gammaproteobacteria bacterium]|nr:hypothetical protein [Gammaproteobacteria bacterium]